MSEQRGNWNEGLDHKPQQGQKEVQRVITALDFPNKESTLQFLKRFPEPIYVKVGMELFYSEGPDVVRAIQEQGHQIFLDLKFHDIPNTVAGAARSCAKLGVAMLNVHAGGGLKMMRAAVEALREAGTSSKLIAITQLTSTSPDSLRDELWIDRSMEETVLHYADLSQQAGLDGVVCSALEAPVIHQQLGPSFLTVTPGIRPLDSQVGDQCRVVTPEDAAKLGTDFIVVGRPITRAADPWQVYQRIRREFQGKPEFSL